VQFHLMSPDGDETAHATLQLWQHSSHEEDVKW